MKNKLLYILLILGLVFSEESFKKLPKFKLKTLDKKKIYLEEFYKDGPIAVNVWNLSCEPCKKEMKYLNEYHKKYAELGFEVVSINIDTPRSISKVKSYIKSAKFDFTILSDPRSEFFRKTGGNIMPYLVLINSDGTIFKRKVGFSPGEEKKLEQEIIDLLVHNKIELPPVIKPKLKTKKLVHNKIELPPVIEPKLKTKKNAQ